MKVKEIYQYLDELAPFSTAYEYDNVGLLVGDREQEVTSILLALDLNEIVLDQAIKSKSNLIITHHPFLFKPLKRVVEEDFQGRLLRKMIKNDISYIAAHTNLDMAIGGVNDTLAEIIGLDKVQIVAEDNLAGMLRIGELAETTSVKQLAEHLKNTMHLTGVRLSLGEQIVQRVAICGGSGADYMAVAVSGGAQVLISGDLKYHEAQAAQNMDLAIIALGHQESEQPVLKTLQANLRQFLLKRNIVASVEIAKEDVLIEHL